MSLNNIGNRLSDLGRREEALNAAEEAVTLRRDLARSRPDAVIPDLAASLNNLANRLNSLGRREEALKTAGEAVRALAPFFLRHPAAFGSWMLIFVGNYLQHAGALGQTPDEEILRPIVEMLIEQTEKP
jgi:tetratricopeptide (TPR) repeat protein